MYIYIYILLLLIPSPPGKITPPPNVSSLPTKNQSSSPLNQNVQITTQ